MERQTFELISNVLKDEYRSVIAKDKSKKKETLLFEFIKLCRAASKGPWGQKYEYTGRQLGNFKGTYDLYNEVTRGDICFIPHKEVERLFSELSRFHSLSYIPLIINWYWQYHEEDAKKFFLFGHAEKLVRPIIENDKYISSECDVFLCWSGPYAHAVAEKIYQFLKRIRPGISVFLSSKDLEHGIWTNELRDRARQTARGLAIASQDALDSSYLMHDMALLTAGNRPITMLLLNVPRSALPEAMKQYQVNEFSELSLNNFLSELVQNKNISFEQVKFEILINELSEIKAKYASLYVTDDEVRWRGNVSR